MKKALTSFLVVFFSLLCFQFAQAYTQTNESGKVFFRNIMSYGGNYKGDRSITLDSNDYPHICAYYEEVGGTTISGLRHIYWNGSFWATDSLFKEIGSGYGKYCSIAINKSNDDVHISYYYNGDLRYVKKSNDLWAGQEAIDTTGDTGLQTSMVLRSDGTPHIYYQYHAGDTDNRLKYAHWTGSNWVVGTLLAGNIYDISSAVDLQDNIHVSYSDRTNLSTKYAVNYANGTLSGIVTAAGGNYYGNSISVGSDDVVKIAYTYVDVSSSSLQVASGNLSGFTSSAYVSSTGGYPGFSPSIALDSQNYEHLSHYYFGNNYLGYAYNSASGIISSIVGMENSTLNSIAHGNNNDFIAYYNTASQNTNFVLLDSVVPTATVALTGKSGDQFSYNLSASDYAKMGGAKYYCIDESNTCDPLTAGTALTSATLTGIHNASGSTVKTVYFRVSDWAGNVSSTTLTSTDDNSSDKVIPQEDVEVVNYDLSYIWKKLPNNSENYWMQTYRYKKYAKNYANVKKQAIKRYWKIKTNLYSYHKKSRSKLIKAESNYVTCYYNPACSDETSKSYKNKVEKYQKKMFRVKVKFYYTQKLSNRLRLKNSDLKKLTKKQAEKKLWLKFYDKGTKTWYNANRLKLITNTKQNTKKNTFATDIRYFKQKDTLFTIGVK
ncbi:MAG: hypothetical protein PHN19_02510 [Patescibacteria group bacterium]|nr:hypothetical protein [Patescibacteria group bacterium]